MGMQEDKLKDILRNNPDGAKVASNLDSILGKLKTSQNQKAMEQVQRNPHAAAAKTGDPAAMAELLKDLLGSAEGQNLIHQVKKATEEQ